MHSHTVFGKILSQIVRIDGDYVGTKMLFSDQESQIAFVFNMIISSVKMLNFGFSF